MTPPKPNPALVLEALKPNHQKRRQKLGADAERAFAALFKACEVAGVGVLRKRPTNVVVGEGGPIYTGTAGVDFTGHVRGGRAVYLEAKHCQEPRFPLDMLRPSQRAELARAHADKCLAGVVILVGPVLVAWVSAVPWHVVAEHLERGAASLLSPVLEAWRAPPRTLVLAGRWAVESSPSPAGTPR